VNSFKGFIFKALGWDTSLEKTVYLDMKMVFYS